MWGVCHEPSASLEPSDLSSYRFPAVLSPTFFGGQTMGQFEGPGKCGTHLAIGAPQVHDFDLTEVELGGMVEVAGV
jgi:hypothetical protein